MKLLQRAVCALALLCLTVGASRAQFVDQRTWGGTATGTNTIAITVPNWTANLAGVQLRFLPANDTTGAVTINVSGVGAVNVLKPANPGLAALTGGEIRSGQLTTVVYDGTEFVLQGQLGAFTGASTLANSALGFVSVNLQLNASVSANALTIAVQTAAGANPTATTPILIPFRDVTIANGDPVIRSITGALSFTISSTNTMGCTSAVACRLWIAAIDNGGTVALCAFNASGASQIFPLNEGNLQTSASGTGGGSSAGTYYCSTSAVTSKAIRILGYLEATEATAGTWATAPTFVQLFGPGIKKPGDIVQTIYFSTSSTLSATGGALSATNLFASITPTSAANAIRSRATVSSSANSTAAAISQLYWVSSGTFACTNSLGQQVGASGGGSTTWNIDQAVFGFNHPNSVTVLTYGLCAGASGGTITQFGGMLEVEEIMSALPANDNGELRMLG